MVRSGYLWSVGVKNQKVRLGMIRIDSLRRVWQGDMEDLFICLGQSNN